MVTGGSAGAYVTVAVPSATNLFAAIIIVSMTAFVTGCSSTAPTTDVATSVTSEQVAPIPSEQIAGADQTSTRTVTQSPTALAPPRLAKTEPQPSPTIEKQSDQPPRPAIGSILGFKSNVVTFYKGEMTPTGEAITATSLKTPMPVFAKSDATLRLLVATAQGDRWIAPSEVEYDGRLSNGIPAWRPNKPTAGGRGISD